MTLKGKLRVTRDSFVSFVALAWGTYEIILGEGRPSVLALIGAILASPIAMRLDETIRAQRQNNSK